MRIILALAVALPGFAFAASENNTTGTKPPKQTETTQDCFDERQWDPETKRYVRFSAKVNGVWDPKIKRCVRPDKTSHLDSDTQYRAVRELAYAGRYDEAQSVLSAMAQDDDRVLTYWGFTHRKIGNSDLALEFYRQALLRNPDNILARSYMGQGFVEAGQTDLAVQQWHEIVSRGGKGTWAEVSLRDAIRTGLTYSY